MSLPTTAAAIKVSITHNAHEVVQVVIDNQRPSNTAQLLLSGKSLTQSSTIISTLFTLCASAQTIANQLLVNALATEGAKSIKFAQQLLALEWLKEHSWQLFLTAKKLQLDTHVMAGTLTLRKYLQATVSGDESEIASQLQSDPLKQQLTHLLGVTPDELINFDYPQWLQWLQTSSAPYAILLMNIMKISQKHLTSEKAQHKRFSSAEQCTEQNDEQGALPRTANTPLIQDIIKHHGRGIVVRFFAKTLEMAQLACGFLPPEPSVEKLSSNTAVAKVAASRGNLLHKVTVTEQKICHYCMLAPTETNFATHSPLLNELYGLKTDKISNLQLTADLLIASYDPCVDYQVELIYA
jgi:hypothetical protein